MFVEEVARLCVLGVFTMDRLIDRFACGCDGRDWRTNHFPFVVHTYLVYVRAGLRVITRRFWTRSPTGLGGLLVAFGVDEFNVGQEGVSLECGLALARSLAV